MKICNKLLTYLYWTESENETTWLPSTHATSSQGTWPRIYHCSHLLYVMKTDECLCSWKKKCWLLHETLVCKHDSNTQVPQKIPEYSEHISEKMMLNVSFTYHSHKERQSHIETITPTWSMTHRDSTDSSGSSSVDEKQKSFCAVTYNLHILEKFLITIWAQKLKNELWCEMRYGLY